MNISSLKALFVDELKDVYSSEKQITKALPKLIKASKHPELKAAFQSHLKETEGHVQRVEQIFQLLGEKVKSKTCEATKGLVEEGKEAIEADIEGDGLHDAMLVCCGQKVEHYEIATYGNLKAWATQMNLPKVVQLLEKTLNEEKAADEKLTSITASLHLLAEDTE